MKKQYQGRVVVPGTATLKALVSHAGFNTLASYKGCKQGKNICTDQNNPELYGKSTVGVALCLPQTIGSTTGGMVLITRRSSTAIPARCCSPSRSIRWRRPARSSPPSGRPTTSRRSTDWATGSSTRSRTA